MRRIKRFFVLLLPVLILLSMLSGIAGAALLDLGPVVTEVNPSTEGTFGKGDPPFGHGNPRWYRDTNRVPLELCTDRLSGMCLTAEPNPAAPLNFPNNMGDEHFWWVGDAIIDFPQQGDLTRAGQALLVQAIEAAFSTGGVVSGAQVSFARMRIRVDTPYVGNYVVTTPFKQFNFTVTDTAAGINFTEDIGIGNPGDFTGALKGSVGPFLYCTNAPIVVPGSGSFVGDPNVPCQVLGSTFPSAQNPTNYFRVQGPNNFDVQTNLFAVSGKIYEDVIPTPLKVDKATYARNAAATEMQVNVFATTQPLSNQRNMGAAFPANYALTGAPSDLQVSGAGIPTQSLVTNSAADGNFFSASGVFADPGTPPATVTVTNVSDTPPTAATVPLVDEVVISNAAYSKQTGNLVITAASYDRVANPALQVFIPGMAAPLGTLTSGQLTVSFPFTDVSVNPSKTYAAPPATVTVVSAKGGTATATVTTLVQPLDPVSTVTIVPNKTSPQLEGSSVVFSASATGGTGNYEYRYSLHDGTAWSLVRDFAPGNSWTWSGTLPGSYLVHVTARNAGIVGEVGAATNQVVYEITPLPPPVTGATLSASPTGTLPAGTSVIFTAGGVGGSGAYEYEFHRHNGTSWTKVQNYSTVNSWVWDTTAATTGSYTIQVNVRSAGSTAAYEGFATVGHTVSPAVVAPAPATGATLSASPTGTQPAGTSVIFTASGVGGSGTYEYEFHRHNGTSWTKVQSYSAVSTWVWNTTGAAAGSYAIQVNVRSAGSTAVAESFTTIGYTLSPAIVTPAPATGATIGATPAGPQPQGTPFVVLNAAGSGGSGTYEFEFWVHNGVSWSKVQSYSSAANVAWDTSALPAGIYGIQVNVRSAGSTAAFEAVSNMGYEILL